MKTPSLSCYGADMTPERWQQLDELFQSRLEHKADKRALLETRDKKPSRKRPAAIL